MALIQSDALGKVGQVTSEPTGYVNNVDGTVANTSIISFNETTRTFSIAPTELSFDIWIKGVQYTLKELDSLQISNNDGGHFIYYNDTKQLIDDEEPPDSVLLSGVAYTSFVYWNSIQQKAVVFAEERHGHVMDWATHNRLHFVDHARYVSGFVLSNFSVDGNGSLDSHVQFEINAGIFKDEDIEHQISDGVVQDLSPILNAPILYRAGANNLWYISELSNYPVLTTGTGRAAYNQLIGGVWQQTEVTNGRYMLMHVFASNDIRHPIVIIQGTNQYNNKVDARDAANMEITTLSGLPFIEFIAIGTIIIQTSDSFTNAVKSIIVSTDAGDNYVDFRDLRVVTPGSVSDHGSLGGLLDYDHSQYAKSLVNGDTVPESYARVTGEPTGFPNLTDSVMSFVDLTRTFSISPFAGSFSMYCAGKLITKTTTQNIQISNVEGIHYIYFNSLGVINETTTFNPDILYKDVFTAAIRWDATNQKHVYLGEERHQFMPVQDHVNMHLSHGTIYVSGLIIGNIIADGDGSLDSHATLSISDGSIRDEDIPLSIVNGSPQTLSTVARISVLYKSGVNGDWRKDVATNFPVKSGASGRLAYNQFTGGIWQQTDVANNQYVLTHLWATNDIENPVIAIQGEETYGNQNAARTGALVEMRNLVLTGLPSEEFVPIASIIYQTSDIYANSINTRIRTTDTGEDYVNWLFFGGSKLLPLRNVA